MTSILVHGIFMERPGLTECWQRYNKEINGFHCRFLGSLRVAELILNAVATDLQRMWTGSHDRERFL